MKELTIENYKCLEKIKFEDLKRVNLFTGRNNTGKSSVLEAISLLEAKGRISWVANLLINRGVSNDENVFVKHDAQTLFFLRTLFYNGALDNDKYAKISIKSDCNKLDYQFIDYDSNPETIGKTSNYPGWKTAIDSAIIDSELSTGLYSSPFYNEDYPFLVTSNGGCIEKGIELWDNINMTSKENYVIDALKIIDPFIERFSYISEKYSNSRIPMVKHKNYDLPVPLNSMGDGINRILNIILALVNCENSVLLIDEFENGLHDSVQEVLWKVIFEVSEKLNIQVFATTHSNDAIHSLAATMKKNPKYEASLYRMANKKGTIKAYRFSKEEIQRAAENDLDLR